MRNEWLEILYSWSRPYVTGTDLHYILGKSPQSRYGIIKRAIHRGYLVPLRRDLYLIKSPLKKNSPLLDYFEISHLIYGPSYISFESALSHHGWIPEAVRTTTCATVKRTKEIETPLGVFSYEHVPTKIFSFGVEQHSKTTVTLFIATPEKALADLIYVRKLQWDSLDDLFEDLRIEEENLQKADKTLLVELINNYPNSRVQHMLNIWLEGISR